MGKNAVASLKRSNSKIGGICTILGSETEHGALTQVIRVTSEVLQTQKLK